MLIKEKYLLLYSLLLLLCLSIALPMCAFHVFTPYFCLIAFRYRGSQILKRISLISLCVFFATSIQNFTLFFAQITVSTYLCYFITPYFREKDSLNYLLLIFIFNFSSQVFGLILIYLIHSPFFRWQIFSDLIFFPLKDTFFSWAFVFLPFYFYKLLGKIKKYATFRKKYRIRMS